MDNIRSNVAHTDATPRAGLRLRLAQAQAQAQALARAAGARLTAPCAVLPASFDLPLALAEAGAHTLPALWEDARRAPLHPAVAVCALTTDLLVFGPHDSVDPPSAAAVDLVASTLTDSGTPGLVLPRGGMFDPQARRARREARPCDRPRERRRAAAVDGPSRPLEPVA